MKKRIFLCILALAAGGAVWFYSTRPAPSRDRLVVSGNIETTDAQLGFKISGRLAARLVDEGQAVAAGQLLATLERTDQEQAVDGRRANLRYVEAVLAELEHGSRPQDIENARAELDRAAATIHTAQAQRAQAQADFSRFATLVKKGVVSVREFELYRTVFDTTSSVLEEAQARHRSAREQLSLSVEGPRQEQIEQARAQVAVAQETLRQSEQQLAYTNLYASFAGVVMSKSAEAGVFLNPGAPVVTVGRLDRVWLRGYVSETAVGLLRLGQEARVRTDSPKDKEYIGRLGFISPEAEFTPKSVQTPDERVKLVFRVKIDLDNPRFELKPGMPADATFRIEPSN